MDKKAVKKDNLKKFLRKSEVSVTLVLIVLCLVTGTINPDFYRPSSFINWFRAIAMALVPCIGLTFALGAGEIDLSVGSVLAFAGVVAGMCMKVFELPVWISIVLALVASAAGGALMGFCVIAFAIPPMIVTMGFQNIFRGFVNVLTAGSPYSQFPQSFNDLSQKTVGSWGGGMPVCVFTALVL